MTYQELVRLQYGRTYYGNTKPESRLKKIARQLKQFLKRNF